jgi:hypothetical protein
MYIARLSKESIVVAEAETGICVSAASSYVTFLMRPSFTDLNLKTGKALIKISGV